MVDVDCRTVVDYNRFDFDIVAVDDDIVVVVVVVVVEDMNDHDRYWRRTAVEQVDHWYHIDDRHFHVMFESNVCSMNVDYSFDCCCCCCSLIYPQRNHRKIYFFDLDFDELMYSYDEVWNFVQILMLTMIIKTKVHRVHLHSNEDEIH